LERAQRSDVPGVSVLVVDDQEPFRSAVCDVILATAGMTVIGEAASGEAALDAIEALGPQMVIMDKRMPGMGGIAAARAMRTRWPELVVVLVSIEAPTPEATEASGAAVFLPKQRLSPRALAEIWQTYGAG
jgi:DNA-binding NarL/FixJ family response regulator